MNLGEWSEQEVTALVGLIDAGVRATGLRSVKEAAVILVKLEEADVPKAPVAPKSEE